MEILNSKVTEAIQAGVGLCLNLGSGERVRPGYFNLDCVRETQPDILADLNAPLSALPDNSVDAVFTRHTLEHVEQLLPLLGELHRVVRADGRIEITVPHFSNPYAYSDPTHVRFFGLYSFFYFCNVEHQPRRKVPNFYTPMRFRVEKVEFGLPRKTLFEKVIRLMLEPLINQSTQGLDWYERRLCRIFPVSDVRYLLRPIKTAGGLAVRAA